MLEDKLTSTRDLKREPKMRTTSSRFMPRSPRRARRRGMARASPFIWDSRRDSKTESLVDWAMAWEMVSLSMWSPERRVIMSL